MVICKHSKDGTCASKTCFNAKPREKLLYGIGYCSSSTKSPIQIKVEDDVK